MNVFSLLRTARRETPGVLLTYPIAADAGYAAMRMHVPLPWIPGVARRRPGQVEGRTTNPPLGLFTDVNSLITAGDRAAELVRGPRSYAEEPLSAFPLPTP